MEVAETVDDDVVAQSMSKIQHIERTREFEEKDADLVQVRSIFTCMCLAYVILP